MRGRKIDTIITDNKWNVAPSSQTSGVVGGRGVSVPHKPPAWQHDLQSQQVVMWRVSFVFYTVSNIFT